MAKKAEVNKQGIFQCTMIEENGTVKIMGNDLTVGENLCPDSYIDQKSSVYGFATRTVAVENGKTYTLSFCGCADTTDGTTLRVYIYKSAWDWSRTEVISNKTETVKSYTFTAPLTGSLMITAYSFKTQSTAGEPVYLKWYKLEEGSVATPWIPNSTDEDYSKLNFSTFNSTVSNPIKATDFYEI